MIVMFVEPGPGRPPYDIAMPISNASRIVTFLSTGAGAGPPEKLPANCTQLPPGRPHFSSSVLLMALLSVVAETDPRPAGLSGKKADGCAPFGPDLQTA